MNTTNYTCLMLRLHSAVNHGRGSAVITPGITPEVKKTSADITPVCRPRFTQSRMADVAMEINMEIDEEAVMFDSLLMAVDV